MSVKTALVMMLVGLAFWVFWQRAFVEVKKEYYADGNIMAEASYRFGRPDGMTTTYYKSGTVRSKAQFRNGRLDGMSRLYFENGRLGAEVSFKAGLREGLTKIFADNGTLKLVETYHRGQLLSRPPDALD